MRVDPEDLVGLELEDLKEVVVVLADLARTCGSPTDILWRSLGIALADIVDADDDFVADDGDLQHVGRQMRYLASVGEMAVGLGAHPCR